MKPPFKMTTECSNSSSARYRKKTAGILLRSHGKRLRPAYRDIAERRLRSLVKRLHKEKKLEEYDCAIQKYMSDGIAEQVRGKKTSDRLYYMPHRAVVREGSTSTRVRVVFDASSHAAGCCSLNDCLETGPKINCDLLSTLLRFRLNNVALVADIEKAFLQVAVRGEDRDALRFLWFEQPPTSSDCLPSICEWRMTRVPFGTSASSFLLGATVLHHLRNVSGPEQEVAQMMADSFCIDDLLTGTDTAEEAKCIIKTATAIMRDACMPLKKWASNCSEIQDHVDSTKSGVSQHELIGDTEGDETARVLGLTWDTRLDTLNFNGLNVLEALSQVGDSKRSVLQTVAKIFDPLGLAAPFAIKAKMVFQQLWQQGVGWDQPIPDRVKGDWDSWKAELADLLNQCESTSVWDMCILRCEDYDGNVQCTLILSKARLAPLKKLSLPRLELMGALIAARTAKFVKHALRMPSVPAYFWADSSIALTWIKGRAARWKVFVCNRVTEIQATSTADQWRHCPGKQNPADCLTRGMTIHALLRSSHWWEGPNWLKDGESQWPKFDAPSRTEESDMEACSNSSQVMHVTLEKVDP
ncbi:uncharacterized protein LOC135395761 [Ornithodoros turicata]|uniref:uncharacterized protein LOC135395761 n=1 Tax=Ornithodoros turicata TaxID=34597 RepID=UPI003138A451